VGIVTLWVRKTDASAHRVWLAWNSLRLEVWYLQVVATDIRSTRARRQDWNISHGDRPLVVFRGKACYVAMLSSRC
jgi:hypothetical protein